MYFRYLALLASTCRLGVNPFFPEDTMRKYNLALVVACSIFLLGGVKLFAATYYISSSLGADQNSGTTKTAPWQHAPGMNGCSSKCASANPQPGDQIILRGGDTWANSDLTWTLSNNGSSGNAIYYGVDPTWYTGANTGTVNTNGTTVTWASGKAFQMNGSWVGGLITINGVAYTIASVPNPYIIILTTSAGTQTGVAYSNSLFTRPIINGQGLNNLLISISGAYVVLDSIEITGQILTSAGGASLNLTPNNGNITAENLDVHNWNRCQGSNNPTSYCTGSNNPADNSASGGGTYVSLYAGLSATNVILKNSNVGTPETGGNIGACGRGWSQVISNYLHDCSQANLHGGLLIHDNIVSNVGNTFDGTTHTNGFYADCLDGQCGSSASSLTSYIYNNWIMNMQGNAAATAIYPNPGTSGVAPGNTVTYYVFNNVITSNGSGAVSNIGDEIDPYNPNPSNVPASNVYDWNNTYELTSTLGTCVNVVSRTGMTMNIVDVRNLHCIAAVAFVTFSASATTSPNSVDVLGQTVSTANGQGYTAPTWQPTSGSGSTIGTGTNLTSFCSGTLAALCSTTTLGGYLTAEPRPSNGAWNEGGFELSTAPYPPTGLQANIH
jgi:hypothetical protein